MNKKEENKFNLPATRWQLYGDVIKQKFRSLILIGLFLFIFSLPFLVCLFLKDYYVSSVYLSINNEELLNQYTAYGLSIIYGIMCLTLLVLSIGISGLSKVLLHLSFEEGFDFIEDFKIGVKQNIKTNLIFTLFYALILYISLFIKTNLTYEFIRILPLGICQGLAFPILLIIFSSNTIYDWKKKDSLLNSFYIYVRYFFVILLFSLLIISPILVSYIPNIIIRYVVLSFLLILIEPFIILGFVIYMNYCFDEGINLNNYPQLYRKGLFKAKQEIDSSTIENK